MSADGVFPSPFACSPLSICWMPQLGYAGLHRTIQNRNFSPIAQNDHFLKWQLHKLYSCIWKIPALALGILLTDFLYWENKVVCHRSQCFCDASEWCLAWSGSIKKCPTKFWVLGLLISVRAHFFFLWDCFPLDMCYAACLCSLPSCLWAVRQHQLVSTPALIPECARVWGTSWSSLL